jgi:hypothetical protein
VNFLPGWFPQTGGPALPTFVLTDSRHGYGPNVNPLSQASVSFGDEHATRIIILAVATQDSAAVEPNAVSIGGVSATKRAGVVEGTGPCAGIWTAAVPTGTTGTVSIGVGSGDMGLAGRVDALRRAHDDCT